MKAHTPMHQRRIAVTTSPARSVPVVVVSPSESLRIVTSSGQPLLEITYDAKGPSIRLAQEHLKLECPGSLNLSAASISMQSKEDVTIKGKTIRLN